MHLKKLQNTSDDLSKKNYAHIPEVFFQRSRSLEGVPEEDQSTDHHEQLYPLRSLLLK